MSNDYRSKNNPKPTNGVDIHYAMRLADAAIDTEVENYEAIAELAIEGLAARKTISEAVAMLEGFELNDEFDSTLDAVIDLLQGRKR